MRLSLSYIKSVLRLDIVKVFSLNAVSTLVKMLTSFISIKVIAYVIGPAGIAVLGQLNNFSSIILGLSNGGISQGITKYVAEYKESDSKVKILLSTALKVTAFCTIVLSFLLIILHNKLSQWILLTDEYGSVFLIFGFTIFLYSLNTLIISILNGYKEFKKYVIVNIVGTIIGLIFTLVFVLTLGLKGALISAVTYQSVVVVATIFILRKLPWMHISYYKERIDGDVLKKYFGFSLMAITTLCLSPTVQMFLRGYVMTNISHYQAGLWEGMNRISGMYLSVIVTSFSIYYLPRLSEISDKFELRKEIFRSYKFIIPLLLFCFLVIYIFRRFIIRLLFTPDFFPMESLFGWQMAGDLFKIASWLLAFLMLAKAKTMLYITTEIIFSSIFLILGLFFVKINGIVGLTQAYLINYILYMIIMVIVFRKLLFNISST
mgnify:CR=1 FL=1